MKITEKTSPYRHLEQKTVNELLTIINNEDKTVPLAVEKAIPQIEKLTTAVIDKMLAGGRLFYIGAGTSGRLGIVDASECPPTYGVPRDLVIGIIAGGDGAIRKAVEFAEDSFLQGWLDLKEFDICDKDVVIGIAASGSTPYVIGALKQAQQNNITTGCIVCNPNSEVALYADFPVEVIVGPEVVTGSTRMKAGTAQKLTLNMITTTTMIKLGRVVDNKMVDMQLSNNKLVERGIKMIMQETGCDKDTATTLLNEHKSVRKAIENYHA